MRMTAKTCRDNRRVNPHKINQTLSVRIFPLTVVIIFRQRIIGIVTWGDVGDNP